MAHLKLCFLVLLTLAAVTVDGKGEGCPSYKTGVLRLTNAYRTLHGAPPLAWDPALAARAQAHADQCAWGHSGGAQLAGAGESIYSSSGGVTYPKRGMDVCSYGTWAWALEVTVYNFSGPGTSRDPSVEIGHFVNMVWAATTKLGCGYAKCPGMDFVVCQYAPGFYASGGGATPGGFAKNVKKTACQAATGDDWCSACAGTTCTACYERPQFGQAMGRYPIALSSGGKCISACPGTLPNCATCTVGNACLACKAGWQRDAAQRCTVPSGGGGGSKHRT